MIDRVAAAEMKVARAEKHVADLERIIGGLSDSYRSTVETDKETGFQVIFYHPPDTGKLTVECALIIGDAVHNLRTAVEYAYLGAIERRVPAALDSHTKFPFGDTRDVIENSLKGRSIDKLCPPLFKWIVSDAKPYRTGDGNIFITSLHDLDISDKHWLLLPVLHVFNARDIIVEDKQGREIIGNTYDVEVESAGPYHIAFPRDYTVKNAGKLYVSVTFGERANFFKGSSVSETLRTFSKTASYVVRGLNAF